MRLQGAGGGGGALRLRDAMGAPGGAGQGDVCLRARNQDGHATSCGVAETDETDGDAARVSTKYTLHPTAAASCAVRSLGTIAASKSQNNIGTSS